jgi:hypothetical protein
MAALETPKKSQKSQHETLYSKIEVTPLKSPTGVQGTVTPSDGYFVIGLHGGELDESNIKQVPEGFTLNLLLAAELGHCYWANGLEWKLYRDAYNLGISEGAEPQEIIRILQHVGLIYKANVIVEDLAKIDKRMTPTFVKSYGMNYRQNVSTYIDHVLESEGALTILTLIGSDNKNTNDKFKVGENLFEKISKGKKYIWFSELIQFFIENGLSSATVIGLQCLKSIDVVEGHQLSYDTAVESEFTQQLILSPLPESKAYFNDIVSPVLKRRDAAVAAEAKAAADEAEAKAAAEAAEAEAKVAEAAAEAVKRRARNEAEALQREHEMHEEMLAKANAKKEEMLAKAHKMNEVYVATRRRMREMTQARIEADEQFLSVSREAALVLFPEEYKEFLSPSKGPPPSGAADSGGIGGTRRKRRTRKRKYRTFRTKRYRGLSKRRKK